jgi:MFS family permease
MVQPICQPRIARIGIRAIRGVLPYPALLAYPGRMSSGPFGESWRAWVALLVGVVAISAYTASSMTFAVLMKPILADLGWDRTDFAAAMTVRMAAMVVVLVFIGVLTDRLGARLVLAAGALLIGIGNVGLSFVHSLPGLYGVMAWLGPGQAAIGSIAASALVLRLFERRRSIAIGILNGGDNLITSGIYPAAAGLLAWWGWRATVATLGSAYFVLAALMLLVLHRADGATPRRARRPIRLATCPGATRACEIVCLTYAGIYAFITRSSSTCMPFSPTSATRPPTPPAC